MVRIFKTIPLAAFLSCQFFHLHSQQTYEPGLLITSPAAFQYDKYFEKEIKQSNKEWNENLQKNFAKWQTDTEEKIAEAPQNIKIMNRAILSYAKQADFSRKLSFDIADQLVYSTGS